MLPCDGSPWQLPITLKVSLSLDYTQNPSQSGSAYSPQYQKDAFFLLDINPGHYGFVVCWALCYKTRLSPSCSLLLFGSVDKRTQDPVCLSPRDGGRASAGLQPSRSGHLDFPPRVPRSSPPQPLAVLPSRGPPAAGLVTAPPPAPPQPRSGGTQLVRRAGFPRLPALSCLCGRTPLPCPAPAEGFSSGTLQEGCPQPPGLRHRPNPEPHGGAILELEGKTRGDRPPAEGWGP